MRLNRTPRPGHASYASYQKYGEWDDAIGAGFFSGRYTATIVAAAGVQGMGELLSKYVLNTSLPGMESTRSEQK